MHHAAVALVAVLVVAAVVIEAVNTWAAGLPFFEQVATRLGVHFCRRLSSSLPEDGITRTGGSPRVDRHTGRSGSEPTDNDFQVAQSR